MRILLCLLALGISVMQALALDVGKNETTVTVSSNGKPCIEYRYAEVPFKPYVAQLYTPSGVAMLRDSPLDHKHHHALMFAICADGVDFWSEVPKCGKQSHRQIETGNDGLTHLLDWTGPDGRLVVKEERTITVNQGKDLSATLLTWQSRLETPAGRDGVKLTGSHYFGLGVRFAISMDKIGTFSNSSGQTGDVVRGTERLVAARWCAYSAPVDGKMVTVAVFDHPSNLRHPNRMFTMSEPFSYIAATLNLWKEPITLRAGEPLIVRYGVAAWDGRVEAAEIEKTCRQWIAMNSKIRLLILSGANNHDWKTTTPVLKEMYEYSGRFTVDVTNNVSGLMPADFATYDALVCNYTTFPDVTGHRLPAETERALLDYVSAGHGFVLFHAASTAWSDWPEFCDMIGMTWEKGRSGHGKYHSFAVNILDKNHPVTAGMSDFQHMKDELYGKQVLHKGARVLASAFSDKSMGGSGTNEPMIVVAEFGKGRVFHNAMGHDVKPMADPAFQTLMLRGTEWAAIGKVTLPIPTSEWIEPLSQKAEELQK
ncbi:MAG: DUF6807 family protein [bacterium]